MERTTTSSTTAIIRRKHERGPIKLIIMQQDGAWPEFNEDPVFKDSHHHPLDLGLILVGMVASE